jgi:very-short-patch-repair endonuclease
MGVCARPLAEPKEAFMRQLIGSRSPNRRRALIALRAQQMRHSATPSENVLWQSLRACKLGVAFRRQVPLGRYIADFFAREVGLAIEVDGPYHSDRRRADERRDAALGRMGYRVLRLEAELVLRNLPEALKRIRAVLAECR